MASNFVDIIYTLIDKVSPTAKKVDQSLRGVGKGAEVAGDSVDSLDKKQGKL
jgi:hypothetical protein